MKFTLILAALGVLLLAQMPAHAYEQTFTSGSRTLKVYYDDTLPHIRGIFLVWQRGTETWDLGGGLTSASTGNTGTGVLFHHPEWREFLSGLGLAVAVLNGNQNSDVNADSGGAQFVHTTLSALGANATLGHPELAAAPVLVHGHSRTAKFSSSYASLHPARALGFIQYHGENNIEGTAVDPSLAAAGQVPGLLLAGENDKQTQPVQYDPYNLQMLATGRASDARWMTGNQWGLPHGGGTGAVNFQRHTIIFPWIAATLNQRLPALIPASGTPTLRLPAADYLGDHLTNFTYGLASGFTSPETKCWLPGPAFGAIWKTYFDNVATATANADTLAQTLVVVSALRPSLAENSTADSPAFSLVRTGAATASLTVNLTWGGTAVAGTDYATPPASVTFAAGQRAVRIALTPLSDATLETEETITLTPASSAAYGIADPASATVPLTNIGGTSLTPLQQWRQTHFATTANTGSAADTADPDSDGVANLLEYALGGNPTQSGTGILPVISLLPSPSSTLQLTFTPQVLTGLTYTVQASSDLSTWSDTALAPAALTVGQPFTFTDSVSVSANPRRFLRLRVTAP